MTSRITILSKRARASCAVLALLLVPAKAFAVWDHSGEIVRGSAQVLEKGEIALGVFAPLQYGITDRLTIASHPVLDLLQLLNFSLRYRFATGDDWLVSATGGFKWELLEADQADRPFEGDFGVMYTWLPHRSWAVSGALLWSPWIQQTKSATTELAGAGTGEFAAQNGISAVVTGHFIAHEKHMLMATLRLLRNTTAQHWEVPTLTAAWVSSHSFFLGDVDIVLGASFGRFSIRQPVFFQTTNNPDEATSVWYPVVDIWKRF